MNQMELDRTRERAMNTAEKMIEAAPTWKLPEFQSGYFEGMVSGYWQSGVITEGEMKSFRERMRARLPPRPAWWDLVSKLGL